MIWIALLIAFGLGAFLGYRYAIYRGSAAMLLVEKAVAEIKRRVSEG